MGGGAWWAAVHGVIKSQTRLSNFTFTFHFHALEKAMAPHSSVLAWRILRMTLLACGEGNGTPLQYSCLENPMGGGAWWAAIRGVAKSWTRLRDFTFTFHFHALEKEMATHSSILA